MKKQWKRAPEMRIGIEVCVASFLRRAKDASKEVREAQEQYRKHGPSSWWHSQYLRKRAERRLWLWAARSIVESTTDGVLKYEVAARRFQRIMDEAAVEVVAAMSRRPASTGAAVATAAAQETPAAAVV